MKMKNLVLGITLGLIVSASFAKGAEVDLAQYYLFAGGMGIDGATNSPSPNPNSPQLALELFEALTIPATEDYKRAGILFMDDVVGLTCRKSYRECFVSAVIPASDVTELFGANAELSFKGRVAEKVWEALPPPTGEVPVGAVTRSAANLSCTKVIVPGAPVTCTFKNINYIGMTLKDVVQEAEEKFTAEDAERLIREAGLL
jgi:hypothetical protein